MSVNPRIGQVSLTSTTRMSLNDRFKLLRQRASTSNNGAGIRMGNNAFNQRGSARNKRLAQQMANRPSVLAALKIKNKSIKQRLGNKRLTRGVNNRNNTNKINGGLRNNAGNAQPKAGRFRLNRNNFVGTTRIAIKRPRAINTGNKSNLVGGGQRKFVGAPNKKVFANQRINTKRNPRFNQRKGFGVNSRRFGNKPFGNKPGLKRNNQRPQLRRNFGKGNRNISGKRWQKNKPNKSQLDADLDAYMAKTKSHLDADLDAYMAEASAN
ncbi:hypothetical protein B4U79_12271 [Dinothrombium tinctorium]|uniref:Chromatin target of PRMT1 protein C-terminal domain-containing protein n=1 Tax=Dinothrombium tinctorium TaxID=1965070 RepID=A0A3S3SIY8_9ACAR|nr:hypothetical protein B4U79_12271 [Dinothrombium tinctorium]